MGESAASLYTMTILFVSGSNIALLIVDDPAAEANVVVEPKRGDMAATVPSDKFRVASSGNVQNANNSYGAISDSKLKENIVDASNKLENLKQVKIRNFNFKGDSQKQIGVIAQELETIFPSMVENHKDVDKDGNDLGTTTKSVKYSVFVPMLIKAMQEQQTVIESLEARITALEAG